MNTTTQFKRVGIKLRVNLLQITTDTARLELNPEVSTVTGFPTPGTLGITTEPFAPHPNPVEPEPTRNYKVLAEPSERDSNVSSATSSLSAARSIMSRNSTASAGVCTISSALMQSINALIRPLKS